MIPRVVFRSNRSFYLFEGMGTFSQLEVSKQLSFVKSRRLGYVL